MNPVARLLVETRPRSRTLLAAVAGAGATACAIGLLALSAWLISRAAEHPPVLALGVAIVGVRAFGLLRGVLRYGERLAGHDAALRGLVALRTRCFAGLARVVPGRVHASGDLLSRYATDVDASVEVLARVLLPYASAALAVAGAAILLGLLLPASAVLLVAAVAVYGLGVPALQAALARGADAATARLRGQRSGAVVELLHGLPELTVTGALPGRLAAVGNADRALAAAWARSSATIGLSGALGALLAGAAVWGALALGAGAVRESTLDSVLLAVVVLTPLAVFEALAGLPAAGAQLRSGRPALARVYAVVDAADPVPDPPTTREVPPGPYTLAVDGVTARWGDGADVLCGLSLVLPPGRRVAVTGPSGVGKSTLAYLLVRFLDPAAGRVTLNGVDLRDLTGEQVRRVVGLVSDDAYCFDATIESNLRIGRPHATEDELRAALAAARLLDWVESLPDGLATPVGEHGDRLSGGQRRRLALARALLADAKILVLDEPTEHLDDATARALTADLLDATVGRTVVLITHRPYGLDDVDEVIALSPPDSSGGRSFE